jgi:hypothetical protein
MTSSVSEREVVRAIPKDAAVAADTSTGTPIDSGAAAAQSVRDRQASDHRRQACAGA